jgi:hypothetical protein
MRPLRRIFDQLESVSSENAEVIATGRVLGNKGQKQLLSRISRLMILP